MWTEYISRSYIEYFKLQTPKTLTIQMIVTYYFALGGPRDIYLSQLPRKCILLINIKVNL